MITNFIRLSNTCFNEAEAVMPRKIGHAARRVAIRAGAKERVKRGSCRYYLGTDVEKSIQQHQRIPWPAVPPPG